MNITVLHGENIPKTEVRLQEIIASAKEKNFYIEKYNSDSGLTISEFISSESLFETKKMYLLENIDSITPKELESIIKRTTVKDGFIVFVFNKKLGKLLLEKFPNGTKYEENKLTDNIFNFLDDFYPGNMKVILKRFHFLLESYPPEFIIALLSRHLKDLYLLKTGKLTGKDSWKIGKLAKPVRAYSEKQIITIISLLAEADIKSKTGEGNLTDLLDHIIITNLK
jgi:DNA polymerase III delta subunit